MTRSRENVGVGVDYMVINTLVLNTSYNQTRNQTVVTTVFKSAKVPGTATQHTSSRAKAEILQKYPRF